IDNTVNVNDYSLNNWYNATLHEGNYWSDFDEASEGAYDNDSDGIVDSPYNISGGSNQDLYPLTGPWGKRPYQAVCVQPADGSKGVSVKPLLEVQVFDPNNDTMNVSFYDNSGGLIGIATNVSNGGTASVTWSGRSYSKTYSWFVVVNDSLYLTKSETWSFTTKSKPAGGGGGLPPPPSNMPPVADAGGPYNGYVNFVVSFDGNGSYDVDGVIVNYTWSFGDGDVGYGVSPTHVYTKSGVYTVNLTVTDDGMPALTGINSTTVSVAEKPVDKKFPVANAGGPYHGLTNHVIVFDGSDSYDPDGNITKYTWSFGDGGVGHGVNTSHVYTVAGSYTVKLTVTDDDGLTDTSNTLVVLESDSDGDGWSDQEEKWYGTDAENATSVPRDTDDDHVPDSVDDDDDDDGLPDSVETAIGSDVRNETNSTIVEINGLSDYLVDSDDDGIYDVFYNPVSGTKTALAETSDGKYLVDSDGDGTVDYVYDPASGGVETYGEITSQESQGFQWLPVVAAAVLAVVAIAAILYFKARI
ncbi:MAG: PKD domain-containing protein, partial [Thermoplasmata archaeon]|nr:PKD domain-containing protein [Thermoplasmata archaeon]